MPCFTPVARSGQCVGTSCDRQRVSCRPDRFVNPKPDEPAKHQVVIHLFHQLALGPDREKYLQQAGTDQAFRWDRGTALIGIECREIRIKPRQRIVHNPPDRAQRMLGGNACRDEFFSSLLSQQLQFPYCALLAQNSKKVPPAHKSGR